MIEAYFGKDGLRYNIGRIHMNSCDFALGNYTYIEDGDAELKTFSIAHDEKEILPFLTDAIEKRKETYGEDLTFLVSPWSPPAFHEDKRGNEPRRQVKGKNNYATWAAYFVKFIQAYRAKGINIRALTVQNEPAAVQTWDSCVYTAEEEAEFVGNYLGEATGKSRSFGCGYFRVGPQQKRFYLSVSAPACRMKKQPNISKVLPYTGIPEIILRQLKWYKSSIQGQK